MQLFVLWCVSFQLQAKKTDQMKAAETSLKVLKPTKETSDLIKQAQAEYDGMFLLFTRVHPHDSHSWSLLEFTGRVYFPRPIFLFPLFLALPDDAKIHNLLSLANKDSEIMDSPETMGSNLLIQHQQLMLEHYGHKHTVVLPDDVIQRLLLGVSFH